MSSVRAHHKRGAVRWDVVRNLAPGIVLGSLIASLGVFSVVKGNWLAFGFSAFVSFSAFQMLRNKQPKPGRSLPGTYGQLGVGGAIGFLRGMFGSSKNKSNGSESVLDVKGTDQSASESSDGEMSEDDWASLNRVFYLDGHVDAAFDATNRLSAASDLFFDPLQT